MSDLRGIEQSADRVGSGAPGDDLAFAIFEGFVRIVARLDLSSCNAGLAGAFFESDGGGLGSRIARMDAVDRDAVLSELECQRSSEVH